MTDTTPESDDPDECMLFQADIHRGVIVVPMYHRGRKVIPSLYESKIVMLLDDEGEEIDGTLDIEGEEPVYAVCVAHGDAGPGFAAVEIDYRGATIH